MTTESEILQRIAKAIRLAYIARGNAGRMTFFIRPAWLDAGNSNHPRRAIMAKGQQRKTKEAKKPKKKPTPAI